MSAYTSLAKWYDELTRDVDYEAMADFYESALQRARGAAPKTVLDLCCGTGTLTLILSGRGYELISVDSSPDMLMAARDKAAELGNMPLFLCQDAAALDLYGTVDAAFMSLDAVNYIAPDALAEVFSRLALFVEPGGALAFDARQPEALKALDGCVSVDESEGVFCVWRADYDAEARELVYGMDLFEQRGNGNSAKNAKNVWTRSKEEHIEYAHDAGAIADALHSAGFDLIETGAGPGAGRAYYIAKNRGEHYLG